MALILTRDEFKNYCMRCLGEPVIQINVAEEQIQDRIDDAIARYHDFHFDGTSKVLLKHQVTQQELDAGEITIPDYVYQITRIIPTGGIGASAVNLQYVAYMTDIASAILKPTGGMESYARSQSYFNLMNDIFRNGQPIEHIRYGSKLKFLTPGRINVGDFLVLECYVVNSPIDWPRTWNDSWLQRYATELIRRQWAHNLMKYENAQLPSGITVNASGILAEANENLHELEEELRNVWEVPAIGCMA